MILLHHYSWYVILLFGLILPSWSITPVSQLSALQLLYNSTNGPEWNWKDPSTSGPIWSFDPPQSDPCSSNGSSWQGIRCSFSPNVCQIQPCNITWIGLVSYGLNGTLPSEFFQQLPTLQTLLITFSANLDGKIPTTISFLTNLEDLILGATHLTGSIPSQLFNLTKLRTLQLEANDLTGTISPQFSLLSQLQMLSLSSNNLFGPIPTELGLMTLLSTLYLSANYLSQRIPSQLGQLTNLEILSLRFNQFTGTIPPELGNLRNIVQLSLDQNILDGTIPSELCSLSQVEFLYLQFNRLSGGIPSKISQLSNLVGLFFNSNHLTGSIPSTLNQSSKLVYLYLNGNELTGSIPSNVGGLLRLEHLSISNNKLTGPLPHELSLLSSLNLVSLNRNRLNGTLSSEISLLSQLTSLQLEVNSLSGTIPPEFGSLSQIVVLYLDYNRLSGSIPSEMTKLSKLLFFSLSNNFLAGFIPSNLGAMKLISLSLQYNEFNGTIPILPDSLQTLYLQQNLFTGGIPSNIGNLTSLASLYLSNNMLSGTIPSNIGACTSLEIFFGFNNYLTGSLPSTIMKLSKLSILQLHQNHLTGPLQFSISSLPVLEQLFLHNNQLTGTLNHVFDWNSSQLVNLDLSNNLFSGVIPSVIFSITKLHTIALSVNCFDDDFPSSMCEAHEAKSISMDGLGVAKYCKGAVKVPFTDVLLVEATKSSIPNCIWSLSNLRTLNLAGNGFRGTISSNALMPSLLSLLSLVISHNYLSGTIPLWLQEKNMTRLDLSNNKLTGDLSGFSSQPESILKFDHSLLLSVNRLSGDLSQSFSNYYKLDILSGNIFGCKYTPPNDMNSESVSCGSEEYDQSVLLMVSLFGMLLLGLVISGCCLFINYLANTRNYQNQEQTKVNQFLRWLERRRSDYDLLVQYLSYYSLPWSYFQSITSNVHIRSQSLIYFQQTLDSTVSFGCFASNLVKSVCVLTILSFLCSLPLYILKAVDNSSADAHYVTHTHIYRWSWTMAFLTGRTPAILLLLVTLMSLIYFLLFSSILDENQATRQISSDTNVSLPLSSQTRSNTLSLVLLHPPRDHRCAVWMIFLLNICVVGTVNGLYLWSTLLDLTTDVRISLQFSMGVFSFFWGVAVIHVGLPRQVRETKSGMWLLTCLYMINSVIIPSFVTILTSPSCFQVVLSLQGLLVPDEEISSSYAYQRCYIYNNELQNPICLLYFPSIMNLQKFTPPFTYSFQCGSAVLTTYIPIYMYSCSLQFISTIMILAVIFSSNFIKFPQWVIFTSPGVWWPLLLTNDIPTQSRRIAPIQLIQPSLVLSYFTNSLILLLTFGLCSPILACYITINICLHLLSWIVLIGRFVILRLSTFNPEDETLFQMDPFLVLLNQQLQGVHSYLSASKGLIIFTSALFFSLICWDIAGDEVGWLRSLWVPGAVFLSVIFLLLWNRLLMSKLECMKYSSFFYISSPASASSHGSSFNAVELFPTISPYHQQNPKDSGDVF